MKEKRKEKKIPPHPTPPKKYFLENKKNLSLPCHPKTQPLRIVSIPKSKITFSNPTPKTLLKFFEKR
jgi:hypothetical protein